jgi:hypothetical protein
MAVLIKHNDPEPEEESDASSDVIALFMESGSCEKLPLKSFATTT